MPGLANVLVFVFSLLLFVVALVLMILASRRTNRSQLDEELKKLDIEKTEIRSQIESLAQHRKADEEQRREFLAGLTAEREELRSRWALNESQIKAREDRLAVGFQKIDTETARLATAAAEIEAERERLETQANELAAQTERLASLSASEARELVLARAEGEAQVQAVQLARQIEAEATRSAQARARKILVTCLQRLASDQTAESTVSAVPLPSEDMKGRIIGREGRNIRVFEQVTGVNVLVDDTPETVVLSSFDPVRREVARLTLTELIADGRIHPTRIEEVYRKCAQEIDDLCVRAAEDACAEVGITNLHPALMELLGVLKYRTSYGQNVLGHLVEAAQLAGLMAAEIGLDVETCKRATFLHDLGKAVTHEQLGSHAAIGAEIAQKYGEHPDIVHAIAAHHGEIEPESVEAVLVQAADAMSGGRPGARRETLEAYVERLERLEELAATWPGVDRVFAMQAGREIRVMVRPDEIGDERATELAREIATQIEAELTYPGTIRVTVVRESRAIEVAR